MSRRILVGLAFGLAALSLSAQSVSVRISHAGRVHDIVSDPDSETVFSAGEDGTVRRWSVNPAALLAEYQISHNPVTKIAIHPERPLVAALATDRKRNHVIHIWDLERRAEVARRYLDEEPLYLHYSPAGRYLVYGTADFRSIHTLDGSRASPLPYLRLPLGLVSYVLFSTSERTAVAYAPGSGVFRYLEVRSGEEIRTVRSVRDLEHIAVLSERKRNVAAKSGDQLVIVDIYTGEQRDGVFIPGIQSITVNPNNGTIAVVSEDEGRMDFSSWQFTDGALTRRFLTLRDLDATLSAITYHDDQIVSGTDDGSLFLYSRFGGGRRLIADYPLANILDFEVAPGRMYLSLPGRVLSISSDIFSDEPRRRVGYVFTRSTDTMLSREVGLEPIETGELILWTNDGVNAAFTFLESPDQVFDDFETPLVDLRGFPDTLLALERSGRLKGVDPLSLDVVFEYSAVGIQTMVVNDAYGIVAGKNAAGIIDTALIRIDPRTGETVGVETDPFFVYDLQVGEGERELFSIGLETRAEATHTVVSRHSGRNLERTTTIMLYPGEDLGAGLYVDPETYDVYTTAGFEGVKMWDGRRIRQYDAVGSIPRVVRGYGQFIYAINRDATISVWSKETGQHILRLYVFEDGSWIAHNPEGFYAMSDPESESLVRYLDLTEDARRGTTVEDYRMQAPFVLP